MKILNIGQLAETEVPLLLMPEQQAIVSKIEELLSDLENGKHQLQLAQQQFVDELERKLAVCDKIEETINQSLQQAETLKQSILKKAFEGKLI